jgi:uncharacterized protein YkwD
MKRALAAALVLLLPALAACTTAEPPGAAEPSFYTDLASPQAQIDPQMALSMLNGYRANNGVAPLALDPQLTAIAQAYADRMAAADDHGHNLDGRSDLATPPARTSPPAIARSPRPFPAGANRPTTTAACSTAR